jgi:hypothetical protein
MSKLAPGRYGDRVVHAGDPETFVRLLHQRVSLNDLTPAQLDALAASAKSLIETDPSRDK